MDLSTAGADIDRVIVTAPEIQARLKEIAAAIEGDYVDRDLLVIGILKGAVMTMADLVRALNRHVEMDWMAVSSYGSGTKSSGVVRILKDLDRDITGRHVLIVEDILDTGLTLAWLKSNLQSRGAKSVEIFTKADALGLFGSTVSEDSLDRMGDIVAVPREHVVLLDPAIAEKEGKMVGHHGGFTQDEVLIPLLSYRT